MAKNDAKKLEAFVKWFRSATPFIHEFGERTIVIAFGGEVLTDGEMMQLAHDINVLVSQIGRASCRERVYSSV